MMYKRILLATDSSEYSEGAVREAINIAKSCETKLYAMSVIEINTEFIALAPMLMEKMEQETKKHLEGVKERAKKENVECEIIIREGEEPYKLIVEEAGKKQAGLIVMGRRGRKGLMRLMMGSVTARVIGHSSRNVFVVPRTSDIRWKCIVTATDASKYSETAAKEALSLAKTTGANLYAIAVTRPDAVPERIKLSENALRDIKISAEKEGIIIDTSLVKEKPHESIHEAILEYAKEKNADIIIMGSHGRTGIQRLLMGSVAERVIGHAECAVMVVKA